MVTDPWRPEEEDLLWIEVSSEHRHTSPRVWCIICQRIEKAKSNRQPSVLLSSPDDGQPDATD